MGASRRHWPADRIPLQRAVMALALEIYPQWRTIPELGREIGPSGALTRAVIELITLGLLENHGSAVRPTKAAAHTERLSLPYALTMAKQSKQPADLNRLVAAIVGEATDETPPNQETAESRAGRVGGRKGGKGRAARMTADQRSEAARRAANARWSSRRSSGVGDE